VEELELVALGRCEPLFGSPSIASVLKGAIAQPTAKYKLRTAAGKFVHT